MCVLECLIPGTCKSLHHLVPRPTPIICTTMAKKSSQGHCHFNEQSKEIHATRQSACSTQACCKGIVGIRCPCFWNNVPRYSRTQVIESCQLTADAEVTMFFQKPEGARGIRTEIATWSAQKQAHPREDPPKPDLPIPELPNPEDRAAPKLLPPTRPPLLAASAGVAAKQACKRGTI